MGRHRININNEVVPLTEAEEDARDAEEAQVAAEYDDYVANHKYKDDRASSYPTIEEQLDMQYWDSVNGTTKWKTAIAKVKSDNAKPE